MRGTGDRREPVVVLRLLHEPCIRIIIIFKEQFNVQALGFSMCVKHGQNPARKENMRCRLNSATACVEEVYCDVAVKLSGNIAVHVLFFLSAILGKSFPPD